MLKSLDHDRLIGASGHRDDLAERRQSKHIFDSRRQFSIDLHRIGSPVDG